MNDIKKCKDGGVCHHECIDDCFREKHCSPLSGSGLSFDWNEKVESIRYDIKFRYWDPFSEELISCNRHTALSHFFKMYDVCLYSGNNPALERYTGIKGKNDVEIYDGDITNHGVVIFSDYMEGPCFCFKEINKEGVETFHSMYAYTSQTEVLGNIHQNPELLECND